MNMCRNLSFLEMTWLCEFFPFTLRIFHCLHVVVNSSLHCWEHENVTSHKFLCCWKCNNLMQSQNNSKTKLS